MSFAGWLLEQARERGDSIAIVDDRGPIGYGQLHARTQAAAARLRGWLPPGRPIVPILAENSTDLAVAYLATLWAGAIPALAPPLSAVARAAMLEATGATLVLGDAATLAPIVHPGARLVELGEVVAAPAAAMLDAEVAPHELALLLFTSGSTGAPRGVMLSTHNLVENTREILRALSLATEDRALSSLPLYYCYGTSVMHALLRCGATTVFDAFRYPQDAVHRITRERITLLPGVPSLFEALVRRSNLGNGAAPARLMISGGRLAPATLAELRRRLPAARVHLRYGVTELTSAASFLDPALVDVKLGSVGRGLPSHPLRVQRPDGTPASPDEAGEIVARSPCVALGYYREPERSAEVFVDGAFHTGDLARVDADGDIFILGRQRDFIKSAGHRISPYEIEDVLAAHADVLEAAIGAEPDSLRGEGLLAFVVLKPGVVDAAPLALHARRVLPPFKVPARFIVVAALPRTASGKLRREALAALAKGDPPIPTPR